MAELRKRQVVVVTGASAGVGRAVVRAFAARGCDLGLIARGMDGLEATKREVEACGGRAVVIRADVADAAAVKAAADRVERELGPIDIWVNNAMTSVFARVRDMTALEYRRVTEVTYLGQVHGTLAALAHMLPRDRGTIIQVGSALAHRAIPLQSAYCASKHAVKGFTESLRTELLHDGSHVHVTLVNLPAMNTPQHGWVRSKLPHEPQPVPPIFQPEIAADAIVYASEHPEKKEMWVAYPTVEAIMGEKIAPALADRYLAKHGFASQQTDKPSRPRPDNLWRPVPGDHGAHGQFDDRARSFSPQLWLDTHRGLVALAAGSMAAIAAAAFAMKRA